MVNVPKGHRGSNMSLYDIYFFLTFAPWVEEDVDWVLVVVAEHRSLVVCSTHNINFEAPFAHNAVRWCKKGHIDSIA